MTYVNNWQHKQLVAFNISLSQLTGQINDWLEHFVTQAIFEFILSYREKLFKILLYFTLLNRDQNFWHSLKLGLAIFLKFL